MTTNSKEYYLVLLVVLKSKTLNRVYIYKICMYDTQIYMCAVMYAHIHMHIYIQLLMDLYISILCLTNRDKVFEV